MSYIRFMQGEHIQAIAMGQVSADARFAEPGVWCAVLTEAMLLPGFREAYPGCHSGRAPAGGSTLLLSYAYAMRCLVLTNGGTVQPSCRPTRPRCHVRY
eukprot:1508509-Rhodomonas_salina.2